MALITEEQRGEHTGNATAANRVAWLTLVTRKRVPLIQALKHMSGPYIGSVLVEQACDGLKGD